MNIGVKEQEWVQSLRGALWPRGITRGHYVLYSYSNGESGSDWSSCKDVSRNTERRNIEVAASTVDARRCRLRSASTPPLASLSLSTSWIHLQPFSVQRCLSGFSLNRPIIGYRGSIGRPPHVLVPGHQKMWATAPPQPGARPKHSSAPWRVTVRLTSSWFPGRQPTPAV